MNIEITKLQYDLIKEALETYYYHCKDESDKQKMKRIVSLEESLFEQVKSM